VTLYPAQSTFVRGEISPRLHSRASLDLYQASLAKCRNFVTLPHGGIRKRGGSYFVAPVKFETLTTRLIEFKFSEDQAYALEIGQQYCRVYAYGSLVTEFTTPWPHTHVMDLQYVQSADVMWLTHPLWPPYKITRRGATSWTTEPVMFVDGPFGQQNLDEARTVYATGTTQGIELVANTPTFSAADPGRIFRLEMESYRNIKPWEPQGLLAAQGVNPFGLRCRYDGNVYRCTTNFPNTAENGWRFGSTPPTHTKGAEPDGYVGPDASIDAAVGVEWTYEHSGYGLAIITGFVNAQRVTANALNFFPQETVGSANAGYRWSFGAFSPNNYPVAVTLFEERLVFASKLSVYASKTGDFSSFEVGEKDDDALEFLLAANEANDIVWLADADGFLAIGTIGGVRALSGSGVDEALTPSSFKNRSSSTQRCARKRPLNTGQAFLYVANGNRGVSEMTANQSGRFESADATQISEHITKQGGGIVSAAYAEYPDPMGWFALGSGEMMGFTYQAAQDVRGFHRQSLGGDGKILDVCVTPGRTGIDDVWMIVRRQIGAQTRTYIEMLQSPAEYGDPADDFFVDCGLSYNGAAVQTVSGLSHLEGQAVDVLADNIKLSGLKVQGGQVALPLGKAASKIHVGLPFKAEADTLELDVGAKDGSLVGRQKRVSEVILSLMETDITGLQIASLVKGRWEQVKLPSIATGADKAPRFTGNVRVLIDDSWEGQGRIQIRHSGPTACTIRSMTPAFDATP